MKTGFLITGLLLLLIANLLMVYASASSNSVSKEGFVNYFLQNAGGTGGSYSPIGAYDNVAIVPDNGISTWKDNSPNTPLLGPDFTPGPDSLFMFKNNEAKPSCCSASYSTDTGCICTTPQQRNYINMRGGNRTVDEGI